MSKVVHLLGIGGTGMGTLAGMLKRKGFDVTGTDLDIYPPMSDRLAEWGITPFKGYDPKNIDHKPDLVVVGNVIRSDNPEMQAVLEENIPYVTMPEMLKKEFLHDKDTIVIAGTHGKSTTTALIAQSLHFANLDPSYLVGAAMVGMSENFAVGSGSHFVIEGDEYDTAYYDKVPKFIHYLPKYTVITSLEFDHADIYVDLQAVEKAFEMLVERIEKDGCLLIWDGATKALALSSSCRAPVLTYGTNPTSDYRLIQSEVKEKGLHLKIVHQDSSQTFEIDAPLFGEHNALNTVAAFAVMHQAGVKSEVIAASIAKFTGIKRRMEEIGTAQDITIVDDFAHHPTAISAAIKGVRNRYPNRRVVVAFEPRSATSCRSALQDDMGRSLAESDVVILTEAFRKRNIPPADRIHIHRVKDIIDGGNTPIYLVQDADEAFKQALELLKPGDVFVTMSNGYFGNIAKRIFNKLSE